MLSQIKITFLSVGLIVGLTPASAQNPAWFSEETTDALAPISSNERETLIYALKEFNAIEKLLLDAERAAEPSSRVQLDYRALREDLLKVKLGVRAYLDGVREQPKRLEKIDGDYVKPQ